MGGFVATRLPMPKFFGAPVFSHAPTPFQSIMADTRRNRFPMPRRERTMRTNRSTTVGGDGIRDRIRVIRLAPFPSVTWLTRAPDNTWRFVPSE